MDAGAAVLAVVALGLVGLSLLTRFVAHRREVAAPGVAPPGWLTLFDVNSEANVPTWFTVALMLTAGVVAVGAGLVSLRAAPRTGRFLLALAGVLLLLSLDELAAVHERLGALGAALGGGSVLHFAWVFPGALLAGALVVGLVAGGRTLRPALRRRALAALAVYLSGALVAEAISGQVLLAHGDRAAYLLVTGLEEFLEMLGLVLVLRAVLTAVRAERNGDGWTLNPVGTA